MTVEDTSDVQPTAPVVGEGGQLDPDHGNLQECVLYFMQKAGQLTELGFPPFYSELRQNRWSMLMGPNGEMTEYSTAEARDNFPEAVDGLIDMLWVILGTLYTYVGPDTALELLKEVARANLSKVDGSLGDLVKDNNGKVVKPQGWTAPDIEGVLGNAGWKLDEKGTPIVQ